MPNVTASDGWWSFENVGPLTTTFARPTSCSILELGHMSNGIFWGRFDVQCTSYDSACYPAITTATSSVDLSEFAGYGWYFSPGLYCPSGWATVGVAARDENHSLSKSGFMTTSTSKQEAAFDYPQTLLASILEPSQTMALCCPSSMTPDVGGACVSTMPDMKPTSGCVVYEQYQWEGTASPLSTTVQPSLVTSTETRSEYLSTLTVYSWAPMITLLHHQSDLDSAATGTSESGATSTATTTSNAAGRIGSQGSWGGLSASLGFSALAMALGASVIFMA